MESCDFCDDELEADKWRGRRNQYESGLFDGTCPVRFLHSQTFEINGRKACEYHIKKLEQTK